MHDLVLSIQVYRYAHMSSKVSCRVFLVVIELLIKENFYKDASFLGLRRADAISFAVKPYAMM